MERKQVIVTGALKGIGKVIAERLEKTGYFVHHVDVEKPESPEGFSKSARPFWPCDISDEGQVLELFGAISVGGPIWGVVNNAGIIRDKVIWKMEAADFDKVVAVNLRGTWLMCREAARHMRENKTGRIVNIASRAWLGNPGQTNYSASKAGVIGLTRSLAIELGPSNILVNAIAPGLIESPLSLGLPPDAQQKLIEAQPTKAMGKPEDVAGMVAFLLNPEQGFITGQTLYVDGGKSLGANMV